MALEEPLSNFEPVVEKAPYEGAEREPVLIWRREWYSWLIRTIESIRSSFLTIEDDISALEVDIAALEADVAALQEVGTFIPVITFGGGSTGVTYAVQGGRYTKLGRVVFFEFRINLSSKGSSTGIVVFTGLPFTSQSGFFSPVSIWTANINQGGVATHYQPLVDPSTTNITFYTQTTGVSTFMLDTNINNNSEFIVGGCYTAA
jgi:hypothetical protein